LKRPGPWDRLAINLQRNCTPVWKYSDNAVSLLRKITLAWRKTLFDSHYLNSHLITMMPRLVLSLLPLSLCLLLCACGNKGDLLQPSQVPPEDAGRYLIPSKPAAPAPQEPADDGDDPA